MISDHLTKVKDKVEFILSQVPETQDCDKKLWLAYMNKFHGLRIHMGLDSYRNFRDWFLSNDIPPSESLRRVRQRLQQDAKYVGTQRVNRLKEKAEVEEILREWSNE